MRSGEAPWTSERRDLEQHWVTGGSSGSGLLRGRCRLGLTAWPHRGVDRRGPRLPLVRPFYHRAAGGPLDRRALTRGVARRRAVRPYAPRAPPAKQRVVLRRAGGAACQGSERNCGYRSAHPLIFRCPRSSLFPTRYHALSSRRSLRRLGPGARARCRHSRRIQGGARQAHLDSPAAPQHGHVPGALHPDRPPSRRRAAPARPRR